jgi:hypothetical protein
MGRSLMRTRRRHSYAVAVAALTLQVGVSALGTIGMCVDRPHTHGGVPAPECLMHETVPDEAAPAASTHGHHHQHDNAPRDAPRVGCSCAADPLTLLTTEIALMPTSIPVALDVVAPSSPERMQSAPDVRLAPLSPPPRPSLS